jgi:hypothetical protein
MSRHPSAHLDAEGFIYFSTRDGEAPEGICRLCGLEAELDADATCATCATCATPTPPRPCLRCGETRVLVEDDRLCQVCAIDYYVSPKVECACGYYDPFAAGHGKPCPRCGTMLKRDVEIAIREDKAIATSDEERRRRRR